MAPAAVPDKKVLEIWTRMNDRRSRLRVGEVKFNIGQLVRISIEKLKFAIGSEKKYTDELFRILKFFRRTPPPVYELEDLNGTLIEGQFYVEELIPVRVTKLSFYKIDKILDKRYRNGILEYLVRWKGYRRDFDSCFLQLMYRVSEMGSSFYVTLFSNASKKAYPDNTTSAFTVHLAHEIDLAGDSWEVTLCLFSCLRLN
jgi:hypothetical protein